MQQKIRIKCTKKSENVSETSNFVKKITKNSSFGDNCGKKSMRKKAEGLCLFRSQNAKNARHSGGAEPPHP